MMYRRKEGKVYGVLTDFDLSSWTADLTSTYAKTSQQRAGTCKRCVTVVAIPDRNRISCFTLHLFQPESLCFDYMNLSQHAQYIKDV